MLALSMFLVALPPPSDEIASSIAREAIASAARCRNFSRPWLRRSSRATRSLTSSTSPASRIASAVSATSVALVWSTHPPERGRLGHRRPAGRAASRRGVLLGEYRDDPVSDPPRGHADPLADRADP